jgi:hypothetical protein
MDKDDEYLSTSGWLMIPESMTFEEELTKAMTEPISASSMVPMIISTPPSTVGSITMRSLFPSVSTSGSLIEYFDGAVPAPTGPEWIFRKSE